MKSALQIIAGITLMLGVLVGLCLLIADVDEAEFHFLPFLAGKIGAIAIIAVCFSALHSLTKKFTEE